MILNALRPGRLLARRVLTFALAVVAMAGAAIPALAALNYVPNEYIVRAKVGSTLSQVEQNASRLGAVVAKVLPLPDTYLLRVGRTAKKAAYFHSGPAPQAASIWVIDRIYPNAIMRALAVPNDLYWSRLWGMRTIRADLAWDLEKGDSSVVVGVLDTGVSRHPDLAARLVNGYDFIDNDADPADLSHHGTHVAGTIAAQGNNSQGVVGVCWDGVKIMPIRVLGADNSGSADALISGLDYALRQGVKVINMSLGWQAGVDIPPVHEAVQRCHSAGIIVCAAAGNSATDVGIPAKYEECICVASIGPDEAIAPYSSYGPGNEVDIAAPGGNVYLGEEAQIFSTSINPETGEFIYEYLQGTSMACPHVAGAAALLLSYGIPAGEVRDRLINSARPPSKIAMDRRKYGAGILDLHAALSNASIRIIRPVKGGTTDGDPEFRINISGVQTSSIKVYIDYGDANEDGIPDSSSEVPVIDGSNINKFLNKAQNTVSFKYSDVGAAPIATGSHSVYVKADALAGGRIVQDWTRFDVTARKFGAGVHLVSFPYVLDTTTISPSTILPDANFTPTYPLRSMLTRWISAPRNSTNSQAIGYAYHTPGDYGLPGSAILDLCWVRPIYDPYDLDSQLGIGRAYPANAVLGGAVADRAKPTGGGYYYDTAIGKRVYAYPAGTGFWMILPTEMGVVEQQTLDTLPGFDKSRGFVIPLYKGWNMIGNPYAHGISWRAAILSYRGELRDLLQAERAGWVSSTLYGYSNTGVPGYIRISTGSLLAPYQGYWLRSFVGGIDDSDRLTLILLP